MADTPIVPVAIVGMAAQFPGAPDLDAYASMLERGTSAITEAPASRIDPVFFEASTPDRLYCKRGGFLSDPFLFDALGFGIMPVAAEGAEPDQLLTLSLASRALADAGYDDRPFDRERTSVILGRGGYLTPGVARLDQRVRATEQILRSLRASVPDLTDEQISAVRADLALQLGSSTGDAAIGLVPNLAASRIANRLDLRGAAYTVDAACASSLVAIDHACRDLGSGAADLVLAGGVHLAHDATFWSVFCQLGALSPSGDIRPFDRRADGLLIGEGAGVVVLKRLDLAERDGDRIYAVIRGTGVASDGRGASLMTPAIEGQVLALQRAWKRAGLDPSTIGLIEAHGTGTPAGDTAELTTLARFFGPHDPSRPRAALGSVKSMIGHTMPAAGIAGLIKAALAVHKGILYPSRGCDDPHVGLEATRLRVLDRSEPWNDRDGPRRAAINAFGFGGINAHVVIEAHATTSRPSRHHAVEAAREQLLTLSASSAAELSLMLDLDDAALATVASSSPPGRARLALFDPTPARRAKAKKIVARGEAFRGRDDIFFSPNGLLSEGGKLAFVFPGVDASFDPRVDDVIERFDLPFTAPRATKDLKDIGMGIVATGRVLDASLRALGVRPDVIAGHSIGEWSGMLASEMVPREAVDPLLESLAPARVEVPGVVFLAAGCGVDKARAAIAGLPSIAISHDNCPHQVLLCGREDSAEEAFRRLIAGGVLCQKLPFRSGYHSPLFNDFIAPHQEVLARLALQAPSVPLWSATTCSPYPTDEAAIHALAIRHVVEPIRFRELTEALFDHGVRVFIQVGTGSVTGFLGDTLRGKRHLAIAANIPIRTGLAQLHRVAAALFVEGDGTALEAFESRRPTTAPPKGHLSTERKLVPIALGTPLLAARGELASAAPHDRSQEELDALAALDPMLANELALGMHELNEARGDVISAYARAREAAEFGPREARFTKHLSVAAYPELADHSFYRQPAGASELDRYPVVPMTMLMSLMMDTAAELVPELSPIALEEVRAMRWLAVAPPVDVPFIASFDGDRRVTITIEGYASGIVVLGEELPPAPPTDKSSLGPLHRAPVSATELYADRWMFHGPDYQGIVDVGELGPSAIRGTLIGLEAKGGLLDNAGQLLGYWVMQSTTQDRLAMPTLLSRVSFYGPEPMPGEKVDCAVRVSELGVNEVVADVELSQNGLVWCAIDGWMDRRFDSDDRVWSVLLYPEKHAISVPRPEGFALLTQPWRASASRDLLARRYLSQREREEHRAAGPRRQASFLMGRIAIKDAVRMHLWERGHGPLFPIEIEVHADEHGAPRVRGPFETSTHVSVAHKENLAVARVSEGKPVGIDLERIAPRDLEFELAAFTESERELLPKADRDAWMARFWVAKEAFAKAGGRGLEGAPKRFVVREIDGARLLVTTETSAGWVETVTVEGHIVGWTC